MSQALMEGRFMDMLDTLLELGKLVGTQTGTQSLFGLLEIVIKGGKGLDVSTNRSGVNVEQPEQ
jgi:hypothetical protein